MSFQETFFYQGTLIIVTIIIVIVHLLTVDKKKFQII